MINVFDRSVQNGEKAYFSVPVGELCHRGKEQFPVIVAAGKKDGPTLWINGTVHGDELNGSYAAWEICRELEPDLLCGNLVVTPICNVNAFYDRQKVSGLDYLDMDTVFPGNPKGMLTQRIAAALYREIKSNATALINFHTMATPYTANPYTVRKIVPGVDGTVNQVAEGMQRAFGAKANCVVDLNSAANELPGVTNGALDITCLRDGIPAFMGEIGQGGRIDDKAVESAKAGIVNVMRYLKMLDGEIKKEKNQLLITRRKFLYADKGGITRLLVKPGEIVKGGERLLQVHYYDDRIESQHTKEDVYVIGIRENPVVNEGDRIAFVGTEWAPWE